MSLPPKHPPTLPGSGALGKEPGDSPASAAAARGGRLGRASPGSPAHRQQTRSPLASMCQNVSAQRSTRSWPLFPNDALKFLSFKHRFLAGASQGRDSCCAARCRQRCQSREPLAQPSPKLSPLSPPARVSLLQEEAASGSLTWAELAEQLRTPTMLTPTTAKNKVTDKVIQSVRDGAVRHAAALPSWEQGRRTRSRR